MKKRVGILTLYHGSYNYGGLLQAYALQQKVGQLGFHCELIDADFKNVNALWLWRKFLYLGILKSFMIFFKKFIIYFYKKIDKAFCDNINLSQQKCCDFKNIIPHSPTYTAKSIQETCGRYDHYIVGSDQVWNLSVYNNTLLLDFVPSENRKIAYAASLNMTNLPKKYAKYLQNKLYSFHSISMREQGATEIIENIIKREAPTVLDPTLLFDSTFWDSVAVPSNIKEPYVLVYMPTPNMWLMKEISSYCKKNGLRMVSFPHLGGRFSWMDFKHHDICSYCGPREFIGLVRNARHIFTTSFHGTAFSCIYHRMFTVFCTASQQNMPIRYTRAGSLLSQFGLEERLSPFGVFPKIETLEGSIDWGQMDERLDELRRYSLAFLKDSLQ